MVVMPEILNFLRAVRSAFLAGRDQGPPLAEELDRFIALIDRIDERQIHQSQPTEIPGLAFMPSALNLSEKHDDFGIIKALRPIINRLNWSKFYEEDDWNRKFINRCANGACVGPLGIIKSNELILDVFLLGPHTLYPAHGHAAVEIYYILGGSPYFQVYESPWEEKLPGSFSLHQSNVVHATKTKDEPMLSVIVWRGDLQSPSWHMKNASKSGGEHLSAKRLW
jgi:hypothetical protein